MEWPARLPPVGGGGVSSWYQSLSGYNLRLKEI